MSGYIFLCSNKTENECLKRLLFGSPSLDQYLQYFSQINVGDTLFLYNYESGAIRGPYFAVTRCSIDIEPNAWTSTRPEGFKYQVRIDNSHAFSNPLRGSDVKKIIPFGKRFPHAQISKIIQDELIKKISALNNIANMETYYQENITSHYIFKCDKITGGKVFDDNVLGAPSELYQSLVGRIQAGDILFVWLLEERKLYGAWEAASRGQYNPREFHDFPAVVYCTRKQQHEIGLDENQLRKIISFNTSYPPYKISFEQGEKILSELNRVNNLPLRTAIIDGNYYVTEDGHKVRSQGELIIDNWLYRNNLMHSYEERVQRPNNDFLLTDFYLFKSEVYIEFWGMISNPEYRKRKEEKVNFYRRHNLNLVELFPRDLSMLSEILKVKLSQFGVNLS